jgi:hypothetical protein
VPAGAGPADAVRLARPALSHTAAPPLPTGTTSGTSSRSDSAVIQVTLRHVRVRKCTATVDPAHGRSSTRASAPDVTYVLTRSASMQAAVGGTLNFAFVRQASAAASNIFGRAFAVPKQISRPHLTGVLT